MLGAGCLALQPVLLSALMLPATAYVIRTLGPEAYGQWVTATALVAATTFLTNLGLRGTFVRAVARDPGSAPQALAEQLGLRLALAVLASIITIVACLLLGYPPVVIGCTLLTSIGLTLTAFASTLWDLLQAVNRLPAVAAINLVGGLVLTAASVATASLGTGPIGVAAAYQVGPLISAGLSLWIVARQHAPVRLQFYPRRWIHRLSESRFFAAQQMVVSLSNNAEALILPQLLGPAAFGFFSAGTLLANRLIAIPDGLGTAAYPVIAAAHRRNPRSTIRVCTQFTFVVLAICLPLALTVELLSGPISQLLFRGGSDLCQQVMRVTIWLLPLTGMHAILSYTLNAAGADASQAKALVLGSACSLGLSFALTSNWGIAGACWSMLGRQGLYWVILALCAKRILLPNRPFGDSKVLPGPAPTAT